MPENSQAELDSQNTRHLKIQIDHWLQTLSPTLEIEQYLKMSFGRVFFKRRIHEYKRYEELVKAGIVWLTVEIENHREWLNNKDALGRPKKLLKFSTIQHIEKELVKAFAKEQQLSARIVLNHDDEEMYADLRNDFHLVKLKSLKALKKEGGSLQNCLGDGAYGEGLITGKYLYFVLRDNRARSHVILEFDPEYNCVTEMRGKQNKAPIMKYLIPLAEFITSKKWKYESKWEQGFLIDAEGKILDVNNLPDKISLHGHLTFTKCTDVFLPSEICVSEAFIFYSGNIRRPADVIIADRMGLNKGTAAILARKISLDKWLIVKPEAEFEAISNTLEIEGTMSIRDNEHLLEMPDTLIVDDWLDAGGTRFEHFGERTKVGGVLELSGSALMGQVVIDNERNIIQPGDMVEIIGDIKTAQPKPGLAIGCYALVMEIAGVDGCYLAFEGSNETKCIAAIVKKLRKYIPTATLENHKGRHFKYFSDGDFVYDPYDCVVSEPEKVKAIEGYGIDPFCDYDNQSG